MTEALSTILPVDAAGSRQPASDSDLGFLWDFWYPALRSTEIVGHRLATAMLLEVPLVLGRTSEGKAFAMRDSCPHRGIPLSYGRFDGKTLSSAAITAGASRRAAVNASKFLRSPTRTNSKSSAFLPDITHVEERDGYVWVYMTSPGARTPDRTTRAAEAGHLQRKIQNHASVLRAAIAHRSRHHRLDGPGARTVCAFILVLAQSRQHSSQRKKIRADSRRLSHEPALAKLEQLALSALEEAHRRAGDHDDRFHSAQSPPGRNSQRQTVVCSQTTVTPVRRDLCRIDFVAAWNLFFLPVSIFRIFGKIFLRQDQETMIQQAEGLKHNPHLMLIDDADRPAKWYFALKANLIESRRTGAPQPHPMPGPVTLHWRS